MKFSNILKLKSGVDFYKLLNEQSDLVLSSVKSLKSYVRTLDEKYANEVKKLENDADKKRLFLVQQLNKTFITPFEREDIYMLSKSLDDILDYYKATVNEMEIYEIKPSTELMEMILILEEGTENICDSVYSMKMDKETSMKDAIKAKKCENKVEDLYRTSIAKLLQSENIKYIIKMRELYRHLSNCADKIDQSADLITHILVKIIC